MRLALATGRVDVDAMLDEITERQLREWRAFDSISPFEDHRGDFRAGIIAATMASIWTHSDGRPPKPTDFMPLVKFDEDETEYDRAAAMQIAKARQIALAMGASP